MTRQQIINALVTHLMISKDKEDGTEQILRRGWRGFDNFTDEELKQEIAEIDAKIVKGLLLVFKFHEEARLRAW